MRVEVRFVCDMLYFGGDSYIWGLAKYNFWIYQNADSSSFTFVNLGL